jgi:tetratricopeptide (TPR) repeat protein
MVTKDGRVKVLDFGLAKLMEPETGPALSQAVTKPVTEAGTIVGTAAYMSPEQAEGKTVDQRSDIFSLGVVLYEMATGRRPFVGASRAALVSSILRDEPPRVTELVRHLPNHFGRIVKLCLVKNVADRFQTASDVRIQLQDLKAELDSPPLPRAETEHARRRPRLRGALLVVLAAVLAMAGYVAVRQLSHSNEAPASRVAEDDSTFVVAVTPFWGATEEATAEGKVMQALVERQVHELIGEEEDARILGKELTEVPRSHDEAKLLGKQLGATAVIWGEVLVLRDDVDIQPYITMIGEDPVGPLPINTTAVGPTDREESAAALEIHTDAPNQLGVRKAKAEEVGGLALLLAGKFYENRDPDRALGLLRRIDPPSSASLTAEGEILRRRGESEEAEDRYRRAIALDSTSARPHYGLGWIHLGRDEYDAAMREHEIATRLAPEWEAPHGGLASVHSRRHDYAAEVTELRTAVDLNPESANHFHHLGHALANLGEFEEAEKAFRRSIELTPASSRNHVCFGDEYAALERYDEALAQYEAALSVNPEAYDAYRSIGDVHRNLFQYEDAIAALERANELDDDDPWSHRRLATTYLHAGRFGEACAESDKCLELAPPGHEYANIVHALCLFHARGDRAMREHLAPLIEDLDEDETWNSSLLRFYAGEIAEDSIWAAAQDTVPQISSEKQCDAYYCLGVAHLLGLDGVERIEPDTAQAVDYFEKCLETNLAGRDEYQLAKATLKRLSKAADQVP